MTWTSPWLESGWVRGVAVARGQQRAATGDDRSLIARLVADQNARVETWLEGRDTPCRDVMIILPRCVKRSCCRVGVDGSLEECRACEECDLGKVARLAHRLGVRPLVAFRSHLAFAAARRDRPEVIVAAACEDRLIKALVSVPEVPALLSPLTGMERMCVGADFDLEWVRSMLVRISREENAGEPQPRSSTV